MYLNVTFPPNHVDR